MLMWPKPAELTSPVVKKKKKKKGKLALYKGQEAELPNDFSEENGSPM